MNKVNKRLIPIFLIIIVIDLITKLIAYNFLPFNEHVYLIGDKLSFYSTYNTDSTGGQADYIYSKTGQNKNYELFLSTISSILIALYILLIYRLDKWNKKKWFLLIPLVLLNLLLIGLTKRLYPDIHFTDYFISWFSKIGAIVFILVIVYLIKDKWIRLFLICILSSGIGNLMSHFYLPYHVVDFISIKGSYELVRIGIFNIADLVLYLSLISIIGYVIYSSIKKQKLRHTTRGHKTLGF